MYFMITLEITSKSLFIFEMSSIGKDFFNDEMTKQFLFSYMHCYYGFYLT